MRGRLLFGLRLAVSLLLVVWLLHSIDFDRVWQPITPRDWVALLLAGFLVNADRLLMSYKWNLLLRAKGIRLPFGEVIRSYYIGTFWGMFLPSTVGGDAVRAYRVARRGEAVNDIVSSVVLERVLGTAAGLVIASACMLLAVTWLRVLDGRLVASVIALAVAFTGVVMLSMAGRWRAWLDRGAREAPPDRDRNAAVDRDAGGERGAATGAAPGWVRRLATIVRSYHDYRHHRAVLLRFVGWSALEQLVPVVCVYLTAVALNLPATLLACALFVPLIATLQKIPISLDGFGVREGLYVYLFALVGMPQPDAFLLGLVSHVIGNLFLLPGFFYVSFVSTGDDQPKAAPLHRNASDERTEPAGKQSAAARGTPVAAESMSPSDRAP